jgi:drug/metabolite transporter (DMT)-like permease
MFWFIVALIGYISFAVVFLLDKVIVSEKLGEPIVYTFYSTIYMLAALLALPFVGWGLFSGIDWLWALLSGITFGFGLWTLFLALQRDETSHISPFNGAFVTIFVYFFSSFFLGEKLTQFSQTGVIILVVSALLLSFQKTKKRQTFSIGFLWAIISGLLFAISHVLAKYLYGFYPFWSTLVWTKAFVGIVGLFILFSPKVYKTFRKTKRIHEKKKTNTGFLIVVDKILAVIGVVCIQYAIALGSVTVVNALIGVQYVLMFILILFFTKFFPKIFNEYFTKKELIVEIIAICLVVLGTAFFVF